MAKRWFSGFTAEQISDLPKYVVSWPAAVIIAGGAIALGWSGTTFITDIQKAYLQNRMDARFNQVDTKLLNMDTKLNDMKNNMDVKLLNMDTKLNDMKNNMDVKLGNIERMLMNKEHKMGDNAKG